MKNKASFQKGYSLPQFLKEYGTEEQCRKALFKWRWPQGYHCPECGNERYCQLKARRVFQYNRLKRGSLPLPCTVSWESTTTQRGALNTS